MNFGIISYGYSIWTALKRKFHCYLDDRYLRNVYRHLNEAGLVKRGQNNPRRALQNVSSTL